MGRHQLCRRIQKEPGVLAFKPAGIPASRLECVNLTLDELEAIRLSDIEGLYQEEPHGKCKYRGRPSEELLVPHTARLPTHW